MPKQFLETSAEQLSEKVHVVANCLALVAIVDDLHFTDEDGFVMV